MRKNSLRIYSLKNFKELDFEKKTRTTWGTIALDILGATLLVGVLYMLLFLPLLIDN